MVYDLRGKRGCRLLPAQSQGSENSTLLPRLEGREAYRLVTIRERDPILRDQCLQACGYACSICGLNLGEMYGDLGRGFIHVHHLDPLSVRSGEEYTDPKKDLIPVCPNCHSIIHRGGRLLAPEDVRKALRSPFNGSRDKSSDSAQLGR